MLEPVARLSLPESHEHRGDTFSIGIGASVANYCISQERSTIGFIASKDYTGILLLRIRAKPECLHWIQNKCIDIPKAAAADVFLFYSIFVHLPAGLRLPLRIDRNVHQ